MHTSCTHNVGSVPGSPCTCQHCQSHSTCTMHVPAARMAVAYHRKPIAVLSQMPCARTYMQINRAKQLCEQMQLYTRHAHMCSKSPELVGDWGSIPMVCRSPYHILCPYPTPCANHTNEHISPCTLHASTPHVLQHVALTYTNMHGECGVAGTGANVCKAPSPYKGSTHFTKHTLIESHGKGPKMQFCEVLEQSKTCPWPSIVQCMLPPKEVWSG
jgi:hypothetical protein